MASLPPSAAAAGPRVSRQRGGTPSRPGRVARAAWRLVVLAALCGLAAAPALAQEGGGQSVLVPNYDRVMIGEVGGLEGGAYTARADDASAGWYNPAGLAKGGRDSISGNGTVYEQAETRQGPDSTTTSNSIPSFVGSKYAFGGSRFAFGFSVVSPVHFKTALSSQVDGVSADVTTYINEGENLEQVTFTADNVNAAFDSSSSFSIVSPGISFAWAVTETFRLGAGVRWHRVSLDLVESGSLREQPGDTGLYGHYLRVGETTLTGSADLLTYEAGVQWELGPFRLGALLRTESKLLSSESTFSANTIESFSRDLNGDGVSDTVQVVDTQVENEAQDFEFRLPREVAVGLAYVGDGVELELDWRRHAAVTGFFQFGGGTTILVDSRNHTGSAQGEVGSQPPVVYGPQEVTNTSVGLKLKASDGIHLHLGAFRDHTPVGSTAGGVFDQVDFTGSTAGVTFFGQNTSTSLGVVRITGEGPQQDNVPGLEISSTAVSLAGSYFF